MLYVKYMCICVCKLTFLYTGKGQIKKTSGILCSPSLPYSFEMMSLIEPCWSWTDRQQFPESSLLLQVHRVTFNFLCGYWGFECRSLCLHKTQNTLSYHPGPKTTFNIRRKDNWTTVFHPNMFLEWKTMLCNLQVSNKELILHMDFLPFKSI